MKYTFDSIKMQPVKPVKPYANKKTDQVVNKILGRTKRNLIDGNGFKLVNY